MPRRPSSRRAIGDVDRPAWRPTTAVTGDRRLRRDRRPAVHQHGGRRGIHRHPAGHDRRGVGRARSTTSARRSHRRPAHLSADRLRADHQGFGRAVREGPPEGRGSSRCRSRRSILILVFASLVAAGMPLLVAGLAIPSSLALVCIVAQQVEMSIFVLNIATMLGLALAIDYSLFIVSRFREELAPRPDRRRGRRARGGDGRQGGRVQRHRGRDRPVRAARCSRRRRSARSGSRARSSSSLGRLRADVPAGRARACSATASTRCRCAACGTGFRPVADGVDVARDVALGARRPRGHAPPDRRARPDLGVPAHRRQPVPAPRAGRPGRGDLSGWRREPRRVRRAPDRVRARRDDPDHHPRRRPGLADRRRPTSTALDRLRRHDRRGREGRPGRRPVHDPRPRDRGLLLRPSRSRRCTPCPPASGPPGLDALLAQYVRGQTVRLDAISPLSPSKPAATDLIPVIRDDRPGSRHRDAGRRQRRDRPRLPRLAGGAGAVRGRADRWWRAASSCSCCSARSSSRSRP